MGTETGQAPECGAPGILPQNLWRERACEQLDFNRRDSARASAPTARCLRFQPSACAETLSVLRRERISTSRHSTISANVQAAASRAACGGGGSAGSSGPGSDGGCRGMAGLARPARQAPPPSGWPRGAASRTGNWAGSREVLVPVPGPAAGPAQTADRLPHTLRALWSKSRVRVTEPSGTSWPSRSRLDGGVLSLQPHSSGQNKGQRRFPRQGTMPGPPFLREGPG